VASRTRKTAGSSPLDDVDPEFLQFALWALSEVGFPDLQVLAWVDFSYEGRWAWHTALLCRDESLLEISFRKEEGTCLSSISSPLRR
jgi:hypothetical protein